MASLNLAWKILEEGYLALTLILPETIIKTR